MFLWCSVAVTMDDAGQSHQSGWWVAGGGWWVDAASSVSVGRVKGRHELGVHRVEGVPGVGHYKIVTSKWVCNYFKVVCIRIVR